MLLIINNVVKLDTYIINNVVKLDKKIPTPGEREPKFLSASVPCVPQCREIMREYPV